MSLQPYTKHAVPGWRPALSINAKMGTFTINKSAKHLMGIDAGDVVTLMWDNAKPEDWYIQVGGCNAFILRNTNAHKTSLIFNSADMARELFRAIGYIYDFGKMPIGEETEIDGMRVFPIITSKIKHH
jgi:hypothetical protein